MHFRSQRKLQGEVSLSDAIETEPNRATNLYLSDVVGRGRHDAGRPAGQGEPAPYSAAGGGGADGAGGGHHPAALRIGRAALPQTQKQVAALYGISRSYVSRIEKKALGKLEQALRGQI